MTNEQLAACVSRAREIASAGGSMHALWDVIIDAEAILAGRRAMLDRQKVEDLLKHLLPEVI